MWRNAVNWMFCYADSRAGGFRFHWKPLKSFFYSNVCGDSSGTGGDDGPGWVCGQLPVTHSEKTLWEWRAPFIALHIIDDGFSQWWVTLLILWGVLIYFYFLKQIQDTVQNSWLHWELWMSMGIYSFNSGNMGKIDQILIITPLKVWYTMLRLQGLTGPL